MFRIINVAHVQRSTMWFKRKKKHTKEDNTPYLPPKDIQPGTLSRDVSDERFAYLLDYAYRQLPDWTTSRLTNLTINIEDEFNPRLFGLFTGIPLTKQTNNQTGNLPAVITIYRETIKRYTLTEADLYEQTRKTLFHEIGHYFGMDHDVLGKHGY